VLGKIEPLRDCAPAATVVAVNPYGIVEQTRAASTLVLQPYGSSSRDSPVRRHCLGRFRDARQAELHCDGATNPTARYNPLGATGADSPVADEDF